MGNTCAISAGSSTQEFADVDAGHQQQRGSRVAVVDGNAAVETIALDSESSTAATTDEEGRSPRRRSKGRKGTGFVRKGDLDEEQLREVQMQLPEEEDQEAVPEGEPEAPARKKGGRKATGFVFKEKLQELSQSEEDQSGGDGDGDESDAEDHDRKKVLFNEGVNETFWLKGREEEEEEHRWKRTSERKPTGKAIQLSPQDLDEVHQQAHFKPEQQVAAAGADRAMPALLVAPAPKRRGRKPTGCPTAQQVAEVVRQQDGDEDEVQSPREASPSSPAPHRQKVRRDTGHPTADSRRTRARRALGRLFGA